MPKNERNEHNRGAVAEDLDRLVSSSDDAAYERVRNAAARYAGRLFPTLGSDICGGIGSETVKRFYSAMHRGLSAQPSPCETVEARRGRLAVLVAFYRTTLRRRCITAYKARNCRSKHMLRYEEHVNRLNSPDIGEGGQRYRRRLLLFERLNAKERRFLAHYHFIKSNGKPGALKQVARALGLTENNASAIKCRIKRKLKTLLDNESKEQS